MWWNYNGNSTQRENFPEILGILKIKFKQFSSKILSRSWKNFRENVR